jgi:hypothetical protein
MSENPTHLSPKGDAELKRLRVAYVIAVKAVIATLRAKGMESESFLEANRGLGMIRQRIKEISGTTRTQTAANDLKIAAPPSAQ